MSAKFNIEKNTHLKKKPFAVPDGYFEEAENRLTNIPKTSPKVISIKPRSNFRHLLAMAASVVLLVSGVWFFWPKEITAASELSQEDIATLSSHGFLNDAETAFLEEITLEELDEISMSNTDFDESYQNLQTQEIEEYYLTTDI